MKSKIKSLVKSEEEGQRVHDVQREMAGLPNMRVGVVGRSGGGRR